MNFKKILFFIILFINLPLRPEDSDYENLGNFEKWNVYSKDNKKLCYMLTEPYKSEGDYNIRGRVRVLVARRPLEKNKNSIVIDFGYYFSEGARVQVEIDKDKSFKLATFNQTAWTDKKKNLRLDDKIIKEMIKGLELKTIGRSSRGTVTYDFYSLKGFTKGFKRMKEFCG